MNYLKTPMFRSEPLRRLVAALPCQHCGLIGSTQAAHANLSVYGKGMGLKASDAALMALCVGCHAALDQGSAMTRSERLDFQHEMIAKTLIELIESGQLIPRGKHETA